MPRFLALVVLLTLQACALDENGLSQPSPDATDVTVDAPLADAPSDVGLEDGSDVDAYDAGPPAILPTTLPGCVAWYRADLGISTDAGVSAWADESNVNDATHVLTQVVAAQQPAWNTGDSAYNGQATVSFIAAQSQQLRTPTWASALVQPYTVMVVGEQTAGAFVDGTVGTQQGRLFTDGSSYTGFWAGGSLFITTKRMTAPSVALVVVDGSSSRLYLNSLTPANGGVGSSAPGGIVIGADWYGTSQLQGKVAEVAYFSRAVTGSEVTALFAYVASRYAILIGP
ncbi:MAG TPA: hypothetical protein VH143_11545 [Kofleriaceae bacterium]|jgi:hypothetical protein|nr:hypothetical protein [Kofleriaceae bacterium]